MDYEKLLEETKEFRGKLLEYRAALDANDPEKIRTLTSELTMLWGAIGDDLIALGMPSEFEQGGSRFPIIESALSPSFHAYEPDHETLDIAQQAVEKAIGKINRKVRDKQAPPSVVAAPEHPPPAPPPTQEPTPEPVAVVPERRGLPAFVWVLIVLAIVAVAWIGGRRQDQIVTAIGESIGAVRAWLAIRPALVKIFLGTVATVVLGICGNLFANMIEAGWTGLWRTHPVKAPLYALLIILSALTLAALTWPYAGPEPTAALSHSSERTAFANISTVDARLHHHPLRRRTSMKL